MTSRAERIRPFPRVQVSNRRDYVRAAGYRRSDTLCHIMHSRTDEVARALSVNAGAEWFGFPWLTLILGSGCLDAPENAAERAVAFAEAVKRSIQDCDRIAAPYVAAAYSFTLTLATDRLLAGRRLDAAQITEAVGDGTAASGGVTESVSDAAARVVYAAALVTQAYYAMGSHAIQAMSRRSNDVVVIARSEEDEPLLRLIDAARSALNLARNGLKGRPDANQKVDDAVWELLAEVREELDYDADDVRSASAFHIRLLTEVAWYYLVESTEIYPGWTDLLLRLMLNADAPPVGGALRLSRPRYENIDDLVGVAHDLMVESSQKSWESEDCPTGRAHGRGRVHRQAAEVLRAQAAAHLQDHRLPPAVVFVSTFDLEMEFALAKSEPAEPFSIAVPIYLREARDAETAHYCWVIADISPPAKGRKYDLSAITEPGGWRLLSASTLPDDLNGRPIVVHLCGAPLIEKPKLTDELLAELAQHGINAGPDWWVTPAITVDEYLAMRQSELELTWLSRDPRDAASMKPLHLPKALTTSNELAVGCRYWLAMGVPFSDPAVRNRVLAQIGAAQRLHASADRSDPPGAGAVSTQPRGRFGQPLSHVELPPEPESPPEPVAVAEADRDAEQPAAAAAPALADIVGAAINLYIDDDEIALLHWLGLDVVEETCDAFVPDLRHYLAHLEAHGKDKRPPTWARCELGRPA